MQVVEVKVLREVPELIYVDKIVFVDKFVEVSLFLSLCLHSALLFFASLLRAHTHSQWPHNSLLPDAHQVPRQVFVEVEVEREVIQYVNQIVEKEVIQYEEAKQVACCLFFCACLICP
jgi:hypothetical protein